MSSSVESVAWHDLEHGGYAEDLGLWRELAERFGGPVLEIGAGTGRVSLHLASRGYSVTALDRDPALLGALTERAAGLPVATACADARDFTLPSRFGLCLVPMQTLQLLGGRTGRIAFLQRARRHLLAGGAVAAAIVSELEAFQVSTGTPAPLPDVTERDGILWWSQPTAVRVRPDHFTLERRREVVDARGRRTVSQDSITLDRLTPDQLEREGVQAGLHPRARRMIGATIDYAASEVVILSA